jgi:tetratricopeptide (TPR) repeat protein
MMVEELHHDDDSLITLASADLEFAADDHLSACTACRGRLETFRMIADALRDEATWNDQSISESPVPETIANLRTFADRMAFEDAEASLLLPDLLMGPREMWMSNLQRHSEYRSAGMVRKLLEAVPAARDTMPRDAVELTALATEIADRLEDATPQLRGAAWRERAYALFYAGDFVAAEKALCASESHFSESDVNDYELARVGIVRALVERGLEKYSSAIGHARECAEQFRFYGDRTKHASAQLAEVHLLFSCCQYEDAYALLMSLKNELIRRDEIATYARVIGNLGYCCWKMRRLNEALQYFDDAAQMLDEIGSRSEAARTRWNAARALAGDGRFNDALARLRTVSIEFERLGMMAAATEASLEVAEILVTSNAFQEAEEICRVAIRRFESSKLVCTAPALTALALMHEAVQNRTATKKLVSQVREYIRRVPDEPHLLFAVPAE